MVWEFEMSNIETKVTYFEKPGRTNTDLTLGLVKQRAEQLRIKNIVVASSTGSVGVKASVVFEGYNLVVVAGVIGMREPNVHSLSQENRKIIEDRGGKIVQAAHSFGTLGRAVNRKFNTIQIDEIIANVLRLFGQGTKVCCEVTCMAVDAGLIRTDEEAIGIGGTGGGADTALVLKPTNTHTFFDIKIREVICKPRLND
ncbi:MAG: uncharacterized protein QG670_1650 [Thermoproteota archaeon]|nr:uncharacterized protein [Thermoproteota archaeon]